MSISFTADIDGDGQPDVRGKIPLRLLLMGLVALGVCTSQILTI